MIRIFFLLSIALSSFYTQTFIAAEFANASQTDKKKKNFRTRAQRIGDKNIALSRKLTGVKIISQISDNKPDYIHQISQIIISGVGTNNPSKNLHLGDVVKSAPLETTVGDERIDSQSKLEKAQYLADLLTWKEKLPTADKVLSEAPIDHDRPDLDQSEYEVWAQLHIHELQIIWGKHLETLGGSWKT